MRQHTTRVLIACTLLLVLLGLSNAQASQNQAMASQPPSILGRWVFTVMFTPGPFSPIGGMDQVTIDLLENGHCNTISEDFFWGPHVECSYSFFSSMNHFQMDVHYSNEGIRYHTSFTGTINKNLSRIDDGSGFYGIIGQPDVANHRFEARKVAHTTQGQHYPLQGKWQFTLHSVNPVLNIPSTDVFKVDLYNEDHCSLVAFAFINLPVLSCIYAFFPGMRHFQMEIVFDQEVGMARLQLSGDVAPDLSQITGRGDFIWGSDPRTRRPLISKEFSFEARRPVSSSENMTDAPTVATTDVITGDDGEDAFALDLGDMPEDELFSEANELNQEGA